MSSNGEHVDSLDGSLSTGRLAWFSGTFEKSLFPVLIAVGRSNQGPRRKLKALGRVIVFFQLIGFVFNPDLIWHPSATLQFSKFVYALQVPIWDSAYTGVSHTGSAIIMFVVAGLLTAYAAVCLWTIRAHHAEASQPWMLRGLERAVRLFASVLYIPILRICAAQIACTNVGGRNRLIAYPEESCFDALPAVLMIVAIIYAAAFVASVVGTDLVMFQPAYNLKFLDNRATGRVDALSKVLTAGMVFAAHFLAPQYLVLGVVFLVYAVFNFAVIVAMLPYHRRSFNAVVAGTWGAACGTGISYIVSAASGGHIAGGILFYVLTATGFVGGVVIVRISYDKQTTWLLAPSVEIPLVGDEEEALRSSERSSSLPVFTRRDRHLKNFCRFDYQLELALRFLLEDPSPANLTKAEAFLSYQCYNFPSALCEVTYAHYLITFKGDPILARVRVNKAKTMEPTVDERMLIKSKETLFEEQRLADAHGGAVTAQSLADMRKLLSKARHFHVETLKNIADFWRELARKDVQLASLPVITGRIENTEHKADDAFQKLVAKFPSSKVVLRAFAQYIEEVKMNAELAQEYNAKADMLENLVAGSRGGGGSHHGGSVAGMQSEHAMSSFTDSITNSRGSTGTGSNDLLRRVTASGRLIELSEKLQSGQAVRRLRITACVMLVGFIVYLAVAFSMFYAGQTTEKDRLALYEASGNRTALLMRACYEIRDLHLTAFTATSAFDPAIEQARLQLKKTLGELEYEHKRASVGLDGTPTSDYDKQKALTYESRVNSFIPVDSKPPGVEQKVVNIIDAGLLFIEHAHNLRQLSWDEFLTIEDDQSFRFIMDNGPGQFRTTFSYSSDLLVEEAEANYASAKVTMIALLVAFCLWLNVPGWVVVQSVFRGIREERNFALNMFLLIPKAVIRHLLREKKYLTTGAGAAAAAAAAAAGPAGNEKFADMEHPESEAPLGPVSPLLAAKRVQQVTFKRSDAELSTVPERSASNVAVTDCAAGDDDSGDPSDDVPQMHDVLGLGIAPSVVNSGESGDPDDQTTPHSFATPHSLTAPRLLQDLLLPVNDRIHSMSDSAINVPLMAVAAADRYLSDPGAKQGDAAKKGKGEAAPVKPKPRHKHREKSRVARASASSRARDEENGEESVPEGVAELLEAKKGKAKDTHLVGVTKRNGCRASCVRQPDGTPSPPSGLAALWLVVLLMAITLFLQIGVAAPVAMLPQLHADVNELYKNMEESANTFVDIRNITERLGELAQIFVATGQESVYNDYQTMRRGGKVDAYLASIRHLGVSQEGNTKMGTYFEIKGSTEHYRSVGFALTLMSRNITPTLNPMSKEYPWNFEQQTNALQLKSKYPTWKHRFSSREIDSHKSTEEMQQIARSCLTSDPYLDDFLLVVHLFEEVHVDSNNESELSLVKMLEKATLLTNVVVAVACAFMTAVLVMMGLLRVQVVTRFEKDEFTLRHTLLFVVVPVLLIVASCGLIAGILIANSRLAGTATPAENAVGAVEARSNAYYDIMDMTRQARVFADQGDPKRFTRYLSYIATAHRDLGSLGADTDEEALWLAKSRDNLDAIDRYLSIALLLAAAGHGVDPLVTRPMAGFAWDIHNESSYESDLVKYPERNPIYSTRENDMTLNATQQLLIARTMLYDRKLIELTANFGTSLDAHKQVRTQAITTLLTSLFTFLGMLVYILLAVSIAIILFGFVGFWVIYSTISAHIASKEISIIRQRVEVPSVQKLSRAFSVTSLLNTVIMIAFFVTVFMLAEFCSGAAWELRQAHQRRDSINAVRFYSTELYADHRGILPWSPYLNASDARVLEFINFLPTSITFGLKLDAASTQATAASDSLLYGDATHSSNEEHMRVKSQMQELYNLDCVSALASVNLGGSTPADPSACEGGVYTPVHRGTGGLHVLFLRFLAEGLVIKNGRSFGRVETPMVLDALSWHRKASAPINDLLQRSTRISMEELIRRFSLGQSLAISAFVICTLLLVTLYFAVAHRGIREISVEETRTKAMLEMIPKDAFNKIRSRDADDASEEIPADEPARD